MAEKKKKVLTSKGVKDEIKEDDLLEVLEKKKKEREKEKSKKKSK